MSPRRRRTDTLGAEARPRKVDGARAAALFAIMVAALDGAEARAADAGPANGPGFGNVGPTAGVGYASTLGGGPSGWGYHVGGRFQLNAGATQSYGLEASYVAPVADGSAGRYLAVGVVLEQTLWRWFYMAIGTIGYVGVNGTARQPFGILTDLGLGHLFAEHFRPSITYRSELIFASPTVTMSSLSVGLDVFF
jgi:hypothetical protein